jgi:hypothetical protein
MTLKITKEQLLILKALLNDCGEVEVKRENGRVMIVPKNQSNPTWELGGHPVNFGVKEASVNLDE